jgi:FAD/FMN-containing dehydrogenase
MVDKKGKKKLTDIVGKDYVLDDEKTVEEYSSDLSFAQPRRPRYVIKPEDANEVQKLVKWANETSVPLIPMSSSRPHFRGDTVPSVDGAVIVDLSRMKKVVRIDSKNRVALFEPGVTFADLIPKLKQEGLRLNMPLLPRDSKSVVGSLLEREPVTMPRYHWDASDPLACTEVIYGSGDRFRTGSASGSGDLDYQWKCGAAQVTAVGPAHADFHRFIQGAQGTMGIVTWVSTRCERLPQLEEPFLVGSSDLNPLLELIHWLIRLRLVDECFILNNSNMAQILADQWPDGFERTRNTLPPWILFYCVSGYAYFPEDQVNYRKEAINEVVSRAGLAAVTAIGEVSAPDLMGLFREPSKEPYWKLRGKGSCSEIFFITNNDNLWNLVEIMKKATAQHNYPVQDVGVYVQPVVQGTSCHCEFNLFFDPKDPQERDRVGKLSAFASEALAANGAFFSRPYGPWAEIAYRTDGETAKSLRKIKKIFDPNNIMNRGKLCF